MLNFFKLYQRSMLWRISGLQIGFLVLFLIGVTIMNLDEHRALRNFQDKVDVLAQKERMVSQITQHINVIFFSTQKYLDNPHSNEDKYDEIFVERNQYDEAVASYRKMNLNEEEKKWLDTLDAFFESYFSKELPGARQKAEQDSVDPRLADTKLNMLSDEVLANSYHVVQSNQMALAEAQSKLDKRLSGQGIRFLLYGLVVTPLAIFLYYRMVRDLSIPLRRLSGNAKHFAKGRIDQPIYTDRADEIGELARSLHSMMQQIHSKEEELVAQNEELLAQQDELQMQQEELTDALAKMEANERFLQRRNLLVQALANTLNRQELLDSIVYNLVLLLGTDKGIILMLDGSQDHSSYGLTETGVEQLIRSGDNGILARIEQSNKPYTIKRHAYDMEKGYVTEELVASDMYVPVLGSNGKPVALIGLTSVGRWFSDSDEEELISFALQVSLALEKLHMYETAESQRLLTQDMLDTIQEGIQLLDARGTTIQANRTWFDLMGLHENAELEMDRKAFYGILAPLVEEPDSLLEFISSITDGREDVGAERIYRMVHPHPKFVRMYYEPLMKGKVQLGYLLVHQDITKEYEADQLKSEFVSTVSHELRTPLASILGFAELLLYKSLSEERRKKYVTTIHQEANRLTALINDFLDLQRIESGRMTYHLQDIEIGKLVKSAVELHSVQETGHRFHFSDTTETAIARIDKDKIKQVLMNVIGNAVKYSPGGGEIRIDCSLQEEWIQVIVEDNGLGIPKESLPNLFEKFYRVDNGDRRRIGGTGLGLSIVREIMTKHEGEVRIASDYGRGTTVSLLFPRVDGKAG